MADLAMLADKQRTVYPEEVTRQLHVMVQDRESLSVIDGRSNISWYAASVYERVLCAVFCIDLLLFLW